MLSRLAHERWISPEIGKLLDQLTRYGESLPQDHDDACLIRVARRKYEKAIKVPADYVARANAHGAASYDAWTRARPANDFAAMVPYLEKTLELSREYSDFFAPYGHIADPHIDDADEGMTTASVRAVFDDLRRELVPLVRTICDQPAADDSCLRQVFPKQAQFDFGLKIAERMGYDTRRGRLDLTHHPFCTTFALGDVRITTRVNERDLGDALFSTLHEAGHAMYEQGVGPALEGTPLGHGTSAGVHESQSRLWENVVARSEGFWRHYYPQLQQVFPDQLGGVPLSTFHRAINKVSRSLIRTDADEVTYNLHVMLRFELEMQMLEGTLRVQDLPEAWNAAMQENLGLTPPDDRRRLLAGRALVRRRNRRRVSGLYHRQHPRRAVLCGGAEGAPGHSRRDRTRRVRDAARLAAREHLPPRRKVHAGRTAPARDRLRDDDAAVSRLPARQVRPLYRL